MCEIILGLGELPVWRGVTYSPGNHELMDFTICADNNGRLFQPKSAELQDKIIARYADKDYSFITRPPGFSDWANQLGDKLVNFALSIIGDRQGLRILEVGGGSSYVAEKICSLSSPTEYVIVDPALKKHKNQNKSINVVSEYFTGQYLGDYDVVLSFNCLEHLPDPKSFLASLGDIRNKSDEPAVIGLIFPNAQNQILGFDLNVFLHEHISYFTPLSICNILAELDLELISYSSDCDEFKLILRRSNHSSSNKELITDIRYDIAEIASGFEEKLSNSIIRLEDFFKSNKVIGFHGATNGLNNLLFLSRRVSGQDYFIFDSDKSKEGMFLPASNAPIQYSSSSSYETLELLLISAMTYYCDIKRFARNHTTLSESQILPLFDFN
jgi:hypothetical protein